MFGLFQHQVNFNHTPSSPSAVCTQSILCCLPRALNIQYQSLPLQCHHGFQPPPAYELQHHAEVHSGILCTITSRPRESIKCTTSTISILKTFSPSFLYLFSRHTKKPLRKLQPTNRHSKSRLSLRLKHPDGQIM